MSATEEIQAIELKLLQECVDIIVDMLEAILKDKPTSYEYLTELSQRITTYLQEQYPDYICHVCQRRPPFPVNLCDWLPSTLRVHRRDAQAGVLWWSIHCLIGMDPLVVCHPPVGKEQASANQRPFRDSVRDDRGCMQESLGQSEAFPPLGAESAVVCYWGPI